MRNFFVKGCVAHRRAPRRMGRWFLSDRATRSIAPGFTITPAEAAQLAKEMAGAGAAP